MAFYNAYQSKLAPMVPTIFDKTKQQMDWQERQKLQDIQNIGGINKSQMNNTALDTGGGIALAQKLQEAAGMDKSQVSWPELSKTQMTGTLADPTAVSHPQIQNTSTGGDGKISDDNINRPGKYYSGIGDAEIGALVNDPSQSMHYWAKYHGYNDAYGDRISSIFNLNDLLRAQGIGGTQMARTNALDWQGRLADRLSGRLKNSDGSGYDYLDPAHIAASIFNTPRADLSTGANSLATSINNPNLQPETQIANVGQFIMGSMQGVLTQSQLDSYSQVLTQYAKAYMDQYRTGDAAAKQQTFLEFIKQNGGQYGGLF